VPDRVQSSWLTLSLTNRCPLQCAHCGPRSGPGERGALTVDIVARALDVAQARRFCAVNLTGGEPFTLGAELETVVRLAAQHGLWCRITTGAFWSPTPAAADRRLAPLAEAGLNELCLSCTSEHQQFVPFINLVHAAEAARRHFVKPVVNLGISADSALSPGRVNEMFKDAGAEPVPVFQSRLIPFGRALESLPATRQALRHVGELAGPCPSLTEHPTIYDNGVVAGCASVFSRDCRPLQFGNVHTEPLDAVLDRMTTSPLSILIHHFGVVALKELVEAHSPVRFGDRYVNICHLCGDILNNRQALDTLRDLGLLDHYAEEKRPSCELDQ